MFYWGKQSNILIELGVEFLNGIFIINCVGRVVNKKQQRSMTGGQNNKGLFDRNWAQLSSNFCRHTDSSSAFCTFAVSVWFLYTNLKTCVILRTKMRNYSGFWKSFLLWRSNCKNVCNLADLLSPKQHSILVINCEAEADLEQSAQRGVVICTENWKTNGGNLRHIDKGEKTTD